MAIRSAPEARRESSKGVESPAPPSVKSSWNSLQSGVTTVLNFVIGRAPFFLSFSALSSAVLNLLLGKTGFFAILVNSRSARVDSGPGSEGSGADDSFIWHLG